MKRDKNTNANLAAKLFLLGAIFTKCKAGILAGKKETFLGILCGGLVLLSVNFVFIS